jgi:flagellar biosynthesis/type III secretory pathway M-ring protein FliF/YscJ
MRMDKNLHEKVGDNKARIVAGIIIFFIFVVIVFCIVDVIRNGTAPKTNTVVKQEESKKSETLTPREEKLVSLMNSGKSYAEFNASDKEIYKDLIDNWDILPQQFKTKYQSKKDALEKSQVDFKKKQEELAVKQVEENKQPPVKIEQLPLNIKITNPNSIGAVYIKATYTNNSDKNIVGYKVTVLLKDSNEKTYLVNYDTILPGETSPNFDSFGPKSLKMDDVQFLEYEITIANKDGSKTYLQYDNKLKQYEWN